MLTATAIAVDKQRCKANLDGSYSCPNDGFAITPDGSNQCQIGDVLIDTKGGQWKYSCTNASDSGDFSWTYDEAGAKGIKEIGHCVYYCGQNTHGYVTDPANPKQILGYHHTVEEPKGPCGDLQLDGNKRTIHVFDKVSNTGVEIVETYNKETMQWTEQSRRTYSSLIDDPPGTKKEAKYSTDLHLVASKDNTETADLRWSPYEFVAGDPPLPIPVLHPGDSVYLDGLSMTDLLFVRPGLNPAPFLTGIRFTAFALVPLDTQLFATVQRPEANSLYYATTVQGARNYYLNVMAGLPIEQALENTPGYASAVGMVDMSLEAPAMSNYGLGALALLVMLAGVVLLNYRGQRNAA